MSHALLSWPRGVRVERVLVLFPAEHAWGAARVTRHGRTLRVEPLGRIPRGPDGRGPEAPPEAVAAEAARPGTWTVLGLPAQEAVARRLDTPFADPAKARQVLPSLLDGHLPFALEKCLHAFTDFQRNPAGHQSALAIAARREEVERQLDSTGGIEPAVVDAEGLALWRQALREAPAARAAGRVVAHAAEHHLTLVLGRGAHFHDALVFRTGAAGSGAADEERADLARRVQRRWRALPEEWQEGPQDWLWCGAGAATGAVEALGAALAPPGATARVADSPATFLERALAAPLLLDGEPALNLLPAARAPRALLETGRGRGRRVAAGWIAAALLPLAAAFAWKATVAARAAGFRAAAMASYETIAGQPCPQPELVQVLAPRELEALRLRAAPFTAVNGPPRSAVLREVLQAAHAQGVQADRLDWSGAALRLQGAAQAANDAETLAARLTARGLAAAAEPAGPGRWALKVETAP